VLATVLDQARGWPGDLHESPPTTVSPVSWNRGALFNQIREKSRFSVRQHTDWMKAPEPAQPTRRSRSINAPSPGHYGLRPSARPPWLCRRERRCGQSRNSCTGLQKATVPQHRDTRGILGSASRQDAEDEAVNAPLPLRHF